MNNQLTRRELLRNTTLAGVGVWLAETSHASADDKSANDKLNIAFVGSGGQANFSLDQLAGENNIVALCDVDDRRAARAYSRFAKAKKFQDFRKMFDKMHKQIDAVVVATPDHIHAPASIRAMRLGKHVYCEKPLAWSIEETRLMAEEAKKNKVATQMGTQGMAGDGARAGVEIVRSGVLGPVREMHVWTDRASGIWPQGINRPKETPVVPKGLAWDLWLGPAPKRPYHPAYVPFRWRGWQDFGTGAIGDMGIHNAAMAYVGRQAVGLAPALAVRVAATLVRYPAGTVEQVRVLHQPAGVKQTQPQGLVVIVDELPAPVRTSIGIVNICCVIRKKL